MDTSLLQPRSTLLQKLIAVSIFASLFISLVYLANRYLPVEPWGQNGTTAPAGFDLRTAFRPAVLSMLKLENPYHSVAELFNPPWTFLLLAPVALLPERLGIATMFVLNFFAYGFLAYRLGAKPLALAAFVLNPLVIGNGFDGNIDWIPALGFILPPQIGLFFVLAKPQIGAGVAIFWLFEAYREGKIKEVVRIFAPVTIAFLLSLVIFGLWPLKSTMMPHNQYNMTLFPWSIPVGLGLLVLAITKRKFWFSVAAAPLLSPYLAMRSYAPALLGLGVNSIVLVIITVALWAAKILGIL